MQGCGDALVIFLPAAAVPAAALAVTVGITVVIAISVAGAIATTAIVVAACATRRPVVGVAI